MLPQPKATSYGRGSGPLRTIVWIAGAGYTVTIRRLGLDTGTHLGGRPVNTAAGTDVICCQMVQECQGSSTSVVVEPEYPKHIGGPAGS